MISGRESWLEMLEVWFAGAVGEHKTLQFLEQLPGLPQFDVRMFLVGVQMGVGDAYLHAGVGGGGVVGVGGGQGGWTARTLLRGRGLVVSVVMVVMARRHSSATRPAWRLQFQDY